MKIKWNKVIVMQRGGLRFTLERRYEKLWGKSHPMKGKAGDQRRERRTDCLCPWCQGVEGSE